MEIKQNEIQPNSSFLGSIQRTFWVWASKKKPHTLHDSPQTPRTILTGKEIRKKFVSNSYDVPKKFVSILLNVCK